jgi:protein-histidine pros-kinase
MERRGFDVTSAEDGVEAIEAWQAGEFDFILMDVQMPRKDGLAATREIREFESERGGHTKIIALTAHALAGDRERCLEAGMDDYLTKPLRFDELMTVMERLGGGSQPAVTKKPPADRPEPSPLVFNETAALKTVGGVGTLLSSVIAVFLETYPQVQSEIEEGLDAGDIVGVGKAAHKLKGELAALGAEAAFLAAKHMNERARDEDEAGVREGWSTLKYEMELLAPVLEAFAADAAA